MSESSDPEEPETVARLEARRDADASDRDRRFELLATVVLAMAAVLTAWAAFQSTKWSGVQANSYAQAGATRVESTRVSTATGQHTIVDVDAFTAWIGALDAEMRAGQGITRDAVGTYQPDPTRASGFLFERFRDEFKPLVEEWLATLPLLNPNAPPTPFALPDYELADRQLAADLEAESEALSAQARQANQRGDNYVLTTTVFAMVLVLTGLSAKLSTVRARATLLGMSSIILVVAAVVVLTFPKEI